MKRSALSIIGLAAAFAACATQAKSPPAGDASTRGRPPVAVTVAPVAVADVAETVDVIGSLAPKFFADVKSEVTGTIAAVYVSEWAPVRKGAPLARLDTTETDAVVEALKAIEAQSHVTLTRARREHERARQLEQFGLITPQALDDAKSAVDAAETAAAAARAQIRTAEARLAKSFIKAPMDGVVAARRVNVGDRVENMGGGDPMFRIVDARMLELTVVVPSARLARVAVGQRVEFVTDARPGRTFSGRVEFINPSVDDASRSVRVTAAVPNADGALKGGLFVQGRIVVATHAGVLQSPREALVNWNAGAQTAEVYVVAGGVAQKRTVKVGAVAGGRVEILEGLAADEQVVIRGGFALRPGDAVTLSER